LLEALNHETQSLFHEVAPSIVRVQLPLPSNVVLPADNPMSKWVGRLDPDSLRRLIQMQQTGSMPTVSEIRPTTMPDSAPAVSQPSPHIIVLRLDRIAPNAIGIVLDDQKHLLVPRFVDKAACRLPVPVSLGNGQWAAATFLASDAQADITILKLNTTAKTRPATIAPRNPDLGTLLLVLSLNPASNRLAVWEGWEPDYSALVNIDGSIAGFTKGGHFLSVGACEPVISELLEHGYVRRAFLGVLVETVAFDDPERQQYSTLAATPALRIRQVVPNSAAERAGLLQGDLILSLAGESVGDPQSFAAAIADRRGNTEIAILRQGQRHLINVDLEGQ
jgi:hypothetical protein